MSNGLEELKRLAYENACCRCQYYIDKKCTNNFECVWKTIEQELKRLEEIDNGADVLVQINRYNELCDKEIVLEIIKKRLIDMQDIVLYKTFSSFNQRRTLRGLLPIPKEEYDLLKELL